MKTNITKLLENCYYSNDDGQNYVFYEDAHHSIETAINNTENHTLSAILGIISDMDILSPTKVAAIERKALERLERID